MDPVRTFSMELRVRRTQWETRIIRAGSPQEALARLRAWENQETEIKVVNVVDESGDDYTSQIKPEDRIE